MNGAWSGIAVTLGAVAAAFTLLRLWQLLTAPPPEVARKAIHVATLLIASAFPAIFDRDWPVYLVCALALAFSLALRARGPLARTLGPLAGSVSRRSYGEACVPVAVAATWWLAEGRTILFSLPVLLLAFADAAAALVGGRIGRHRYRTSEGSKSVEGSIAFALVATVVSAIVLRVLEPGIDLLPALLISLLLGCVLLLVEAVAWRGLDNLLIPIGASALLAAWLPLDAAPLATRALMLSLAVGVALVARRRSTLIGEGVLATALCLFGTWTLGAAAGGAAWLAPPSVVLLSVVAREVLVGTGGRTRMHGIGPVLALAGPGFLCVLLVEHASQRFAAVLLPTSVAAHAGAFAVAALASRLHRVGRSSALASLADALLGSISIAGATALAAGWSMRQAAAASAVAFSAALLASTAARGADPAGPWLQRGLAVLLGAAVGLLVLLLVG